MSVRARLLCRTVFRFLHFVHRKLHLVIRMQFLCGICYNKIIPGAHAAGIGLPLRQIQDVGFHGIWCSGDATIPWRHRKGSTGSCGTPRRSIIHKEAACTIFPKTRISFRLPAYSAGSVNCSTSCFRPVASAESCSLAEAPSWAVELLLCTTSEIWLIPSETCQTASA